jgi:hypothetical protein
MWSIDLAVDEDWWPVVVNMIKNLVAHYVSCGIRS